MFKWAIVLGLGLSSGCWATTRVVSLTKPGKGQARAADDTHLISPYIYGMGTYLREDRAKEQIWELKPTLYRWGGNTSTRYNYKTNSWNSAADWYFHNYSGGSKSIIDEFMSQNRSHGVASMITVPMLGWVAKDGTSSSFPRSVYPKQDQFEGSAGNGLYKGVKLLADPERTSTRISPEFVAGWVQKLKTQFGPHPHFYIMDNEPMLWNSTHRDVQPEPVTYDLYLKKYIEYASAVRAADPEAVIVGPALWGWMAMQASAFDIEGPWSKGKRNTDRDAHGGKPFLEWFLEKIAAEEKARKVSLLDVLDVHFYPEEPRTVRDPKQQLLNATRSFWDRSHTDESWINEKIYFIPRLKEMAKKFKPKAKVSIGEYNFRAERESIGAIVQAEILGIMGREDLFAAQYWDFPLREGTHRLAFLLYRNFDGKGSAFEERSIPNSAGIQNDYSVYSADDGKGKRLTLVLINKSQSETQEFDLDIKAYGVPKSARMVGYNASSKPAVMDRFERKLPAGYDLKIKTRPLSMQIVELNY